MKRKLLGVVLLVVVFFDVKTYAQLCPNEIIIGTTLVGNQANQGSPARRIFEWNDHTIAAIWMWGFSTGINFLDRGTGYNYFDGIAWGSIPTARIEPLKTGYPAICGSVSNNELIISHTQAGDYSSKRSSKGIGPWVNSYVPGIDLRWVRFTIGGNNNQTIHLIGSNDLLSIGGSNTIRYWRSPDMGLTWDIQDFLIPIVDSTNLFSPHGDGYDISSRGNVVAFVVGGYTDDLILCKSTDNGNSWTKTIINQFPIPLYDQYNNITDVNNDGIPDTLMTTDASISVVIENNSTVHVWTGKTKLIDTDPSFPCGVFPLQDGLLYWNETFGPNTILIHQIAQLEDINNDGAINIGAYIGCNIYQCGATSMASAGIDSLNNLYVVYSAYTEDTLSGNPADTSFHNIYFTYSVDTGNTWTQPYRLCPNLSMEQVFPSMAETVIGNPKFIYFLDSLPGLSGNSFIEVIFKSHNVSTGIATNSQHQNQISVFPNPASTLLSIQSNTKTDNATVILYNTLGEQLLAKQFKEKTTIDISRLPQGIYFVTIKTNEAEVVKKVIKM